MLSVFDSKPWASLVCVQYGDEAGTTRPTKTRVQDEGGVHVLPLPTRHNPYVAEPVSGPVGLGRTRWKSGSGGQDLEALENTEATGNTSSRVVVSHDGSVAGGLVQEMMRWVGVWADSQVSIDNSDLQTHQGLRPSAVCVSVYVSVYPSPVACGRSCLEELVVMGRSLRADERGGGLMWTVVAE